MKEEQRRKTETPPAMEAAPFISTCTCPRRSERPGRSGRRLTQSTPAWGAYYAAFYFGAEDLRIFPLVFADEWESLASDCESPWPATPIEAPEFQEFLARGGEGLDNPWGILGGGEAFKAICEEVEGHYRHHITAGLHDIAEAFRESAKQAADVHTGCPYDSPGGPLEIEALEKISERPYLLYESVDMLGFLVEALVRARYYPQAQRNEAIKLLTDRLIPHHTHNAKLPARPKGVRLAVKLLSRLASRGHEHPDYPASSFSVQKDVRNVNADEYVAYVLLNALRVSISTLTKSREK